MAAFLGIQPVRGEEGRLKVSYSVFECICTVLVGVAERKNCYEEDHDNTNKEKTMRLKQTDLTLYIACNEQVNSQHKMSMIRPSIWKYL